MLTYLFDEAEARGEVRGEVKGELNGRIKEAIAMYSEYLHMRPDEITGEIMQRFSLGEKDAKGYVEMVLGVKTA